MSEKFYQMPEPFKNSGYTDASAAPPPYPSAPEEEAAAASNFKKPNAMIDQESDSDYVFLTIKIPGLHCKRKLNLSKAPKNGRLVGCEYRHNIVSMQFVLNEGRSDEKTFKYENKEPFKGPIDPEKSSISFDDNTISWKLRKLNKWKK